MPSEPTILWTDASCYENVAGGVAGIAVTDSFGKTLTTRILWGCRSPCAAEREAVCLAFRLARRYGLRVEIRSDSAAAVRALTPPKGVLLCLGRREDNAAHDAAREVAQEGRERARRSTILTRLG
jgi:hypothetical protein